MFTPTEQRIMDLLADLKLHTKEEIRGCLWDEHADESAIKPHLHRIRQVLRPTGRDIATVWDRPTRAYQYRLISLVILNDSVR